MKKHFLFITLLGLVGCVSDHFADCATCEQAPTTILIPNANNTAESLIGIDPDLTPISKIDNKLPIPTTHNNIEQNQKISYKINNIPTMEQLDFFDLAAKKNWGVDGYISSDDDHIVKYLDDYKTRFDINFATGKIVASTLSSFNVEDRLKNAIVQAILIPKKVNKADMLEAKDIKLDQSKSKPLLYGKVFDQEGKVIEWQWRAARFANYLVENKILQKEYAKGTASYVEFNLGHNSEEQSGKNYLAATKPLKENI